MDLDLMEVINLVKGVSLMVILKFMHVIVTHLILWILQTRSFATGAEQTFDYSCGSFNGFDPAS